ncbi:MAG: hypothetical protein OIF48_12125 [Silicimonas sp.]|nr:hypothetical protein [Silicimonas sp.]
MKRLAVSAMLAALAAPAAANIWFNESPNKTDRAYHAVVSNGVKLQLGCFRNAGDLDFLLISDTIALPDLTGLMIWIELPDGRTGRYPMSGIEYLGAGENALIGDLQLGRQGMEFFANGQAISIDGPPGREIFRAGMVGASIARQDFARTCGL